MTQNDHQFPPSFLLLQQEGYLISSCLTNGLTELRAAHVHNKGAFYSALFNLSVGIERLLKAIVTIDHMLENNLSAPTIKQLKGYGHNIVELYDTAFSIANKRGVRIKNRSNIEKATSEILNLLSSFAQSTRYHNLNALSTSQNNKDPLSHWEEIILSILQKDVSKKQRDKILSQANVIASAIGDITITIQHGLNKQRLTTEESLALPGLHDQAVKFVVLKIVGLLAPIRDLISSLSHEAYSLNVSLPPFPQMQEFLEWVYDERQYVLRKKRWP